MKLDHEGVFEGGLLVLALSCLAGLIALVFGRTTGDSHRAARHDEAAPSPGSVPAERHHHTGSVSAR